jgi:hypothetical protein
MKTYLLLLFSPVAKFVFCATFLFNAHLFAQIPYQIVWGMNDQLSGVSSHVNFTAQDARLAGAHQFSLWPYLPDGNGGSAYVTTYWASDVLPERYMDVTIQAHEFEYSIQSFSFRVRRSETGPVDLVVRTSLDGFSSNLYTYHLNSPATFYTVTVPIGITELSSGISFRIYGYNAGSYLGTFYLDQLVINGEITDIVLPIRLYSFQALWIENRVLLEWQIESNSGTIGFDVEKSHDLITFETIGHVTSGVEGSSRSTYHLFDDNPWPGVNYYRLKMHGDDHFSYYSHVIDVVVMRAETDFIIAPNPSTSHVVSLLLNGDIAEDVSLFHLSGKQIEVDGLVRRGRYIDLFPKHTLSSGLYVLSLKIKGKWLRKKLIVF